MLNSEITYIYGLYADNEIIRYIGKSNNPITRLKAHIKNAKFKKTYKDNWILKMLNEGKEIKLTILETVKFSEWQLKEIYWINKFKLTNKLTNHYNGGEGGCVIKYNLSYIEIKKWVQTNLPKLNSVSEWKKYIQNNTLPDFITLSPYNVYKNRGWVSWNDFLGNDKISDNAKTKKYLCYNECKNYIHLQKIKNVVEWKKYIQNKDFPEFIPKKPNRYFENRGWVSWGDFLGTNRIANKNKFFLSYTDCQLYLINNFKNITTINMYWEYSKNNKFPDFIPGNPNYIYKNNGWISWSEFLKPLRN